MTYLQDVNFGLATVATRGSRKAAAGMDRGGGKNRMGVPRRAPDRILFEPHIA